MPLKFYSLSFRNPQTERIVLRTVHVRTVQEQALAAGAAAPAAVVAANGTFDMQPAAQNPHERGYRGDYIGDYYRGYSGRS